MGSPRSKGKRVKTTTATAPANATSKSAPTQTTNVAVGGGGAGMSSADSKKEDAKDEKKGDPISVARGTVVEEVLDVDLPGLVPFLWRRRYSSGDAAAPRGPLGRGGWTHDYHQWIEPDGDGHVLRNYDGADLRFGAAPEGGSALHRGRRLGLRRAGDRIQVLDLAHRWTREYAPTRRGGPAVLRSIADAHGNRLLFTYDGDLLVRITDTAGRQIHLRHDAGGRVVALDVEVEGAVHRAFSYGYTDAGELASAADPLGRALRYAYDGRHRVVQKWLRNGFSVRYEYDPIHGRCVKTWGDGGLHQVELTYDLDRRTTTTHGEPQPRVFHWDAQGNVLREETFDARHIVERAWDEDHLLLSERNAAGEEHAFEYDARGFLTRHTDPAGNVTRYETVDDLLRRVVRPNGEERRYEHDGFGALWGLTLETGARYSVDRDRWGRIVALHGPSGLIERREYDARHQLARVIGPRGQVTSYEHDALGQPLVRRDPLGRTTRLTYDAAGQIVAIVYPDGARVACEHDGLGNVTRIHKPGGDLRMEYIGTGALARFITEDGGAWRIACDREEKPVRIENPKGERYELRYDRAGRVVEERTFDGRTLRYGYDLSGTLHRVERPDGTWRELAYDALGNVVLETSSHGAIAYERDPEGRLLSATLDEGPATSTVSFARDAHGRVVAETQDGETLRYAWDPENRLLARELPTGEITRYAYDLEGELAAVEHAGHVVRIDRDAIGRETHRHLAGSGVAIASAYDAMSRLVAQDAVAPGPEAGAALAALVQRRWTRDAIGRPTRVEDARWGPTDYHYDEVHNLVRARRGRLDEAFEYDPAGGLVRALRGLGEGGERWSVRQGDVLLRTENAVYDYDACNRRTKRTRLVGGRPAGETVEYLWDCRDRLREVRLPGGERVRYFYDAFGRRTRKVIAPSAPRDPLAPPAPPREVRFLWDGDVLAAEIDSERGRRVFVHEPDTFRPLLQAEQGEVFLYVLDPVGAPRELLDVRGRVAWAAVYSAWGKLVEAQQDRAVGRARPVESPFRLLGQYADEETGLACTRFRYWDPDVGRWCSPDPLGIDGGGRLFGFAGSPTFRVDPWGLIGLDEEGYYVYGLYRSGEKTPYYVGVTSDTKRREKEHWGSERLEDGSTLEDIQTNLKYKNARGYEQAYIEFYGTKPADAKGKFPQNEINSFRHARAEDPSDDRGKAFEKAYKEKMAKLEQTGTAKAKQGC